jgi:hypothetical protein
MGSSCTALVLDDDALASCGARYRALLGDEELRATA